MELNVEGVRDDRGAYENAETVGAAAYALSVWKSKDAKGEELERLLRAELPKIREAELKQVWLWKEIPDEIRARVFPRMTRQDAGVDLLGERKDGGWVAIQAKCFGPKQPLRKGDLRSFNQATGHTEKVMARWVVTTTGKWSPQVERSIPGCAFIHAPSQWANEKRGKKGTEPPKALDQIQEEARRRVMEKLEEWDRVQVKMACGTGKTLTSQRIAEEVVQTGEIVVYATPSIGLTSQSRREWLKEAVRAIRTVVVCSDREAGTGGGTGFTSEVAAPVTTEPTEIAQAVRKAQESVRKEGGYAVVFTTYQSMEQVCKAQEQHGMEGAALMVGDEGHRTTGGVKNGTAKAFQMCHERLKARKRLYQTATPRVYAKRSKKKIVDGVESVENTIDVIDMSDQSIYGPPVHEVSFAKALEARKAERRLCDYRVVVVAIPSTGEYMTQKAKGAERISDTSMLQRIAALALVDVRLLDHFVIGDGEVVSFVERGWL